MSDEINYSVPSPGGDYYPQDFSLEDVVITTDFGQEFNIRSMVVEMSFFEDIYAFVVSGYIIIKDAVGLVEKFKLDGNEFIRISYGKNKSENDAAKIERTFRVYKVSNRLPVGNLNAEHFTLHFCTETMLLSEQLKVSKSYTGKKIATDGSNDGIINNILLEQLNVDPKRLIDIEETYGTYDFIVPRLKPLEAISWLSTYARPYGGKQGADMLFFETSDGFCFRSIQSMLESDPYATYKYQPKNLDFDNKSFGEGVISVLDYEIVKTFDSLESTNTGIYANKLISIDPLTRSLQTTKFNYSNYAQSADTMNEQPVIAPSTNSLGVKQTEAYDSRIKVAIGNSNQTDVGYIKDKQGSTAKDIYLETYVPYRTAQLNLANYTVLKMTIPGDTSLTVGRTVEFNLYSLQIDDTRKLDDYFSGKYLVTAIRHIIQTQGVFQTVVEMAKESVNVTYIQPDNSATYYKEVINA